MLPTSLQIAASTRKGHTSSSTGATSTMKALMLLGVLLAATRAQVTQDPSDEYHEEVEYEYTPYDGWYNNRAHPDWGGAETQLLRRVSTAYSDGSYEPAGTKRPNPISISDAVMGGPTGMPSFRNRTAFLVFFGQQVVEEILDAQRPGCPPEYFNIDIPVNHSAYNPEGRSDLYMPFLRSRYDQRTGLSPNNPRQQLNEISSFIDGTLFYGPNKAWADALRRYEDGLLLATNDTDDEEGYYPGYNDIRLPMANPPPPRDHYLKPIRRFFRLGNPRGNENPYLLTFGILWFRLHNFRARQLKKNNDDWSDERLFNEARKWTIAVYQKIVMYDWLPSWLNETVPDYEKYDTTSHPGIAAIFQSAAMRFGHTLVPPGVFRRNAQCVFRNTSRATYFDGHRAVRTCNVYWNPQEAVQEYDIDEFLMGMASQITEREDNIITPDLRGSVFGPLEFSRRDLMAINIQRARDHGLPDYNTARREFGLPAITQWEDINPDLFARVDPSGAELFANLSNVYKNNLDDVDIWVGGLLETRPSGPGPLFTAIIMDQFVRIRNGDRFWFENYELNGLFTADEVQEIRNITLKEVIMRVTNITTDDIQDNPFFFEDGDPCPQPFQLNGDDTEALAPCTPLEHFDYFVGSEWSFILSLLALGLVILLAIVLLLCLANMHGRRVARHRAQPRHNSARQNKPNMMPAAEWMGSKEGMRDVFVKLDEARNVIAIMSDHKKVVRTIDLNVPKRHAFEVKLLLGTDHFNRTMSIKVPNEFDLILKFDEMKQRDTFLETIKQFFGKIEIRHNANPEVISEKLIYKNAFTKADRQVLLEKFFRMSFAHAFKYGSESPQESLAKDNKEILHCELTKAEFAESLSLKLNSLFVENMFNLVDKDNDGYLSFREFLDVIVIFAKGSAESKAELLFKMYDLNGDNELSKKEFKDMLKSLLELASENIGEDKIDEAVNTMFNSANLEDRTTITLREFTVLLDDYKDALNYASLNFDGVDSLQKDAAKLNKAIPNRYRNTIRAYRSDIDSKRCTVRDMSGLKTTSRALPQTEWEKRLNAFQSYWENQKRQLFWVVLYTLVCIGIFAERSYYYSVEREHAGLRRIAGYGVTVTRGAASGMMFTYSCLLVTMCRNLITFLRETFLNRYIPFDAYINMHVYIAMCALFFTVMHIIGHGINFYHISTQTANDLTCLFRNYFHATDELPKLHYWLWNTLTGFTGVLLTIVVILMYTFALPYSRRHAFRAFWFTHHMYGIFYVLMILHGAGRLVQPPFFHFFFLGPVVLFILDRLVSVSRKKIEIAVVKAELLPSDVTYLEFKRPQNFEYKSGQWVKIASLVQSKFEYHPFTLTSAPHEENLSVHIRAVGPWTMNLRKLYDASALKDHPYPKIYLDGAYGEGHQDWYKYEVSVLVGGGIGVTPFASILKDIAHRSSNKDKSKFLCKKVYFLWVTRTQRQFEWMTDIIRQVEEADTSDLVATHIFITQFQEKFDIRTTMLYICERHFQKISNRSLFTGLHSVTHFGRPNFDSFFNLLRHKHSDVGLFGAFSCGPPPMTASVEKACSKVNKSSSTALFVHHYENF